MAIVTAIKGRTQSRIATGKVIDYVSQEKKTMYHDPDTNQSYRLISGHNCVAESAYREFMATKQQYNKMNGVFYKQYVQSFKPDEIATPSEIHQMGIELAEYFKGFEVLIATHIDNDHHHNHLIVNSVNAETGLKIQFNEKSLNALRKMSDDICRTHGLETLKPYEKNEKTKGMSTREYRAADRGKSWKFRLISAIDNAMENSNTKADFIANMEQQGYGVKWIEHHKYITYTTPDGMKCRDNRLHEEKYLKEEMTKYYELKRNENEKQTGEYADTGRTVRGVHPENPNVRNTAGNMEAGFNPAVRNRTKANSNTAENRHSAGMGEPQRNNNSGTGQPERKHRQGNSTFGKKPKVSIMESLREYDRNRKQTPEIPISGFSDEIAGKGYDPANENVEAYRDRNIDTADNHRGNVADKLDNLVTAAEAIANLIDQPKKEPEKPEIVIERKNKKQKDHSYDKGISM